MNNEEVYLHNLGAFDIAQAQSLIFISNILLSDNKEELPLAVDIANNLLDTLAKLTPPEKLKKEHEDLLDAFRLLLQTTAQIQEQQNSNEKVESILTEEDIKNNLIQFGEMRDNTMNRIADLI